MTFKDKRIILTGAAGGIGEALARQLAAEGARLALADINAEGLGLVAEACRRSGSETIEILTDVTDREQCQALVARAVEAWGGVDILLSNAGVSMRARFDEVTDISFFERLMAINYFGPLYCTYYALPYLKESLGRIVVVTSSAGKLGAPMHTGYAASKHALHGFFDSLRTELAGTGVGITLVAPMYVKTGIRRHRFEADGSHPSVDPYHDSKSKSMTAEQAAGIIIRSARKGKREVNISFELKAGVKLKPFVPGIIDYFVRRKVDPV
ncbi:MAG: SDR family oxidoreductase [Fidelibacterota bacterium]|nr:MAG: SDR family oxidoreductase [Candidatus Neomarinimicrobiota bacterium]